MKNKKTNGVVHLCRQRRHRERKINTKRTPKAILRLFNILNIFFFASHTRRRTSDPTAKRLRNAVVVGGITHRSSNRYVHTHTFATGTPRRRLRVRRRRQPVTGEESLRAPPPSSPRGSAARAHVCDVGITRPSQRTQYYYCT